MASKKALERLYQEREFAYANKVNHKGKNWHSDIEHYDNIGKCLEIIENALNVLNIFKKYFFVKISDTSTCDEFYYILLKDKNTYDYIGIYVNKEEKDLLKEWFENDK